MPRPRIPTLPFAALALCAIAAVALCAIAAAQQTFDVSTVKPNAAADNRILLQIRPGGNFVATGVSLKLLIREAFDVRDFQVSGGPGWMDTDRWDIVAKAEGVTGPLPIDRFRPMLRALIEDRFQLKAHRETAELPIYSLVVAKNGPKLTANTGEPGPMIRLGRGSLNFKKAGMAMLATQLSQQLGRSVVDKTDLQGDFDFTLEWTPEPGQGGAFGPLPGAAGATPPVDTSGPSIFTALQEQLGLRLVSEKGPVEIIVVDRVEKPSDN